MLLTLQEFSQIVGARLPDLRYDTDSGLFGMHDKKLDMFMSMATANIGVLIANQDEDVLEKAGASIIEADARKISAHIEDKVDDGLAKIDPFEVDENDPRTDGRPNEDISR